MKLCARRRLCNRKISLLVTVPASTNEPSFPFGVCSEWSLRPCSLSVPEFSDFTLLLCCLQELAALPHQGDGYCSQSPADKAGEKPWSTHGPEDSSWEFLTEVPAGLTWLVQTWQVLLAWGQHQWIHRPWLLSRDLSHSTVKGTKHKQSGVLAVW